MTRSKGGWLRPAGAPALAASLMLGAGVGCRHSSAPDVASSRNAAASAPGDSDVAALRAAFRGSSRSTSTAARAGPRTRTFTRC